uniref:Uncharacterized protein n=1 Tax=Oryza punctata TaxID=4537 RepID=A0A0E0K5K7_ORYPU
MCNQEVDDVHQWLPSEILRDINIVDKRAAEGHSLTIVEDLAARLTSILVGSTVEKTQCCVVALAPLVRSANSYGQHFFAPPPMKVWSFISNDEKLVPVAPPRFAPVMWPPQLVLATDTLPPPLEKWSGAGGTVVFLPQARAYNNRTTSVAMGTTGLPSLMSIVVGNTCQASSGGTRRRRPPW